jgi:peptidoglycan/xylan/chitin deacetylase (PgdA/CDA1 family)
VSEAPQRVALTFDAEHPDRPGAGIGNVDRVLSTLSAHDATATFFVQGRWCEADPATVRRIADDGHLVGNHSHYHARMTLLADEGIRADVQDAEAAIVDATGTSTRPWFRCPFGDGHDDPRVQGILHELGYRDVHWDVELEDWEPSRSKASIVRDAIDGTRRHGDGAVVLLHTWPSHTADALPTILRVLGARGTRFVRLDDLPEESLP